MSRMPNRWLAVAGARGGNGWPGMGVSVVTVALAALLAGCGSPAGGGPGRVGAGQHRGPVAGTRGAAVTLDRQLLSRFVLPPGARPAQVPEVARWLRQSSDYLGPAGWPTLQRLFLLGWPGPAAEQFFLAHPPTGMKTVASGSASHHGRVTVRGVSYQTRGLPPGIAGAQVGMDILSAGPGRSLLRATVQAIWYPPRSAAEHLNPAAFSTVTISARRLTVSPTPHPVTRTFTGRTVITGLTSMLNSLPASPDLIAPCPLPPISYQLTFTRPHATRPDVVVTSSGCLTDQVTVVGTAQPALQDSGKLGTVIARLLHITARP
jgi:hypothetical protein